jgi:hypothetical protein
MKLALLWLLAAGAWAQQFELGAMGGGAFLGSANFQAASGSAAAGFADGPSAGVLIGQDRYERLSGELRYLYQRQSLRLDARGLSTAMSGESHAIHYDLLWHVRGRKDRIRPFLAAGGGLKLFRGTGAETAWRPLMEFAYLTRTHQLKPLVVVGAGVKFRLSERLILRFEARDQASPFPAGLIAPAAGVRAPHWLHEIVPTVALSWVF